MMHLFPDKTVHVRLALFTGCRLPWRALHLALADHSLHSVK